VIILKRAKIYYCPQCNERMIGLWIKLHRKSCKNFIRVPYVYCPECDLIKSVDNEDESIIVEKMYKYIKN